MQSRSDIIIFDGVCNLCHAAVNFVIEHDTAARFVFAPLQSNTAKRYLSQYGVTEDALDSVILIKAGRCYLRSDAAIEIAKSLDTPWPLLRFMRFLPKMIRDGLYNAVAKRRYSLFGTRAICILPTEEVKQRFIED
ncbi:DCC1-like thiol-disulfide oxidoreductase family protein [Shewanella gelidimarina]|uniref:thiol-disulfide oxidoreductase DCC family protein n=1 Tax=Shewanella gelidimarina TaxID=56813 RepID=UPI00200FC06C|nr:DCC1-like thiol-disulfide oxidoreductase family protein [Shewanella gelidimarina]MCL1056648.1 DCC1-like thiol-disulfide oxidoreductase family protein [Shewanella gelidimarina]